MRCFEYPVLSLISDNYSGVSMSTFLSPQTFPGFDTSLSSGVSQSRDAPLCLTSSSISSLVIRSPPPPGPCLPGPSPGRPPWVPLQCTAPASASARALASRDHPASPGATSAASNTRHSAAATATQAAPDTPSPATLLGVGWSVVGEHSFL